MKSITTIFVGILTLIVTNSATAANIWTGYQEVGYIRTYDGKDFSIALSGLQCQIQKDYFYLDRDEYDTQAMISLVMMAKAQGARINILHNPDINGTHCYVRGITIE